MKNSPNGQIKSGNVHTLPLCELSDDIYYKFGVFR